MNAKEANDILHSLTPEKRQEAFTLYNVLGKAMQGEKWEKLNQQQKLLIKFSFAIEYGRRTANKPVRKGSGNDATH